MKKINTELQDELVSICIPTFNGERYLQQALLSIKYQTYKNFEVIISDDDSRDETIETVRKFKEKVNFSVNIFHHIPSGIGANWNNCIRKAKGKYIKFLFQDDVLSPTCIEDQVKLIEKDRKIGLVACKRKFIIEGELNTILEKWINNYKDLQRNLGQSNKEILIITKDLIKSRKFLESPLNKIGEPSAVLFRKSIVSEIGYFREDLQQILDYEFYYRLLRNYNIAILNKELVSFRIHPLQTTNINRTKAINDYEIYERILFENFFWYLNSSVRKRLFFKYHLIGKVIQRLEDAAKRKS